jgi:alpha-ribazole phosphatase
MDIYLVRHTKVGIGKEYCYGISDVELDENFDRDFAVVKEKLDKISFTRTYTSNLKRCRLLSEFIAQNVLTEDALLEMNLGDWELMKWSEIDQTLLEAWMSDFVHVAPPNAENFMDFSMKSVLFFDKLASESQSSDVMLVVTHSGVIRSLVCHVLNMPLANAFNFEVDFGSVTKIEITDGWYKLKYLNH